MDDAPITSIGVSRRDLLRRGAMAGGTLLWAAPVIVTIAGPASASGSPAPTEHGPGKPPKPTKAPKPTKTPKPTKAPKPRP